MFQTKNEIPWTGIMKFPNPINSELMGSMHEFWKKQNWGSQYENFRRPKEQLAIFPHTRVVQYYNGKSNDPEFKKLIDRVMQELQTYFSIKMTYWIAELVLLLPRGMIPYHCDMSELCRRSSRIIIPLTDTKDITYYFRSWSKDTPTNTVPVRTYDNLCDDEYQIKMDSGFYYFFNHRIPHQTVSESNEPRATFSIDVLPESEFINFNLNDKNLQSGITEFEKTKILPPIL